jgi:ABC-2 type transport system permease protein
MNLTIAQLTLRSLFGRARVWLLAPLPALLLALTVLGHWRRPAETDWIPGVVQGLGFAVVVPIMALVIGASVLGSEIDDGTLVHLLAKPLSRREILLAKLAVAAGVTGAVTGAAMVLAGLVAHGARFGLGLAAGAVLASVAYCALFVALSVVSRWPVLIGLVYVLLWEGLLTNLLAGTRSLAIEQYAITVADRVGGGDILRASVGLPTALVMATLFVLLGTVLAVERLRSFTLAGETH